jgi:1-acyl-sn-glycerol-3-phosphate acyltransferase
MSYLDSFVLAAALPVPISFVAKSELKKNPVTHHFLRRLDTEFIDRWNKERRDEDTRRIIGRAHDGRTLLFFAEGGMSRQPGLKSFKLGAFVAAVQAELPVVPVAIRGTRSMLRPDTYILRRGPVVVTVRPAIDTRALRTEIRADSWAVARKIRDATRASILSHCGEPDTGGDPV